MKTIHPGHLEHRFCIFGCQILCITDLAIMPLAEGVSWLQDVVSICSERDILDDLLANGVQLFPSLSSFCDRWQKEKNMQFSNTVSFQPPKWVKGTRRWPSTLGLLQRRTKPSSCWTASPSFFPCLLWSPGSLMPFWPLSTWSGSTHGRSSCRRWVARLNRIHSTDTQ